MQKLLIIGTAIVPAKYISRAVSMMGLSPVFLGEINSFPKSIIEELSLIQFFDVDIHNQKCIELVLYELGIENVAAVTSLYECHLEMAIEVANKFGIKGPDKAILTLRNKNNVAKLIPKFSPPYLSFDINYIPIRDINGFIDKHGVVIIKPGTGAGGVGAVLVKNKVTKEELYELIKTYDKENRSADLILQPLISGTLYSVEGYCLSGKSFFIGISRRARYNFTEVTNYFPSDEDLLIQNYKNEMLKAVDELIISSAFQNGYFHTEFICSQEGFFLIDANFGRIAGTSILEQIATSYSLDPALILKHIIDVGVFQNEYSKQKIYTTKAITSLSVSYGSKESLWFNSISISPVTACYHTVLAKEGTQIEKIGVNDDSWIGTIAGEAQKVREGLQSIKINTSNGYVSPFWLE